MPDVFLSYNREDRPRAALVYEGLEAEGLSVWWDTILRAGENYDEVTERNLRDASSVVVLWSKRSVQSKWVRAEATLGQRKSALVPAMIEECDRPLLFELIQTTDLVKWQGDRSDPEWRGFIDVIKARVAENSKTAKAAVAAAAQAAAPAQDTKSKHLEAATALHAATIETTFWQSIKDGNNAADLEAYLERYPQGHFASLARNRIKALRAPKPEAPRSPPPKPAAPAPAPTPQAKAPATENRSPAPRPGTPPPAARAPAQPQPAPQPRMRERAAPRESNLNFGLIAAILVVVGALGGGVWFWLNMSHEKTTPTATASSEPTPASASDHRLAAPAPEQSKSAAETPAPSEAPPAATSPAPAQQPLVVADASGGPPPTASSSASPAANSVTAGAKPGTIKDCAECPELAVLPAGKFQMGSPKEEPGRYGYEGPQHEVTIARFAIATHEVTFDEWDACVADGGCNGFKPADRGWGRGAHPVIGVSWGDAQAYTQWLSKKTRRAYRLPTEAEWEYAERGGTSTAYWWGEFFDGSRAPHGQPSPVGSFAPNNFGLYDMVGNAAEWVEDCYQSNYVGAPVDGSAINGSCENRTVRGGSYKSAPTDLRSANRGRNLATTRAGYMGFRPAATP